jgi:hypothetical protein
MSIDSSLRRDLVLDDPLLGRSLTEGERTLLRSVFADHIDYDVARIYGRKWRFFQPRHTAMAPNGNVYFPPAHYLPDYSLLAIPLSVRAWFVHEGAHLYQFYGLGWNVIARGIVSRRYSYKLREGKPFARYGLEQMGSIAADYYTLTQYGSIKPPYTLADFSGTLPLV